MAWLLRKMTYQKVDDSKKRGGSARRISQILFTPCGAPIIHLSDQPGISPATRRQPNRAGRPFNPLFDLAPRRVCPADGLSPQVPVVSCSTLSPLPPEGGGLFSVALSIGGACHRPPGLDSRVLCPAESGLSSPLRARPVTRAHHGKNQRSR